MRAHRYRLPLAIASATFAAGGATFLLRPRSGLLEPAAASATDYFTPAELQAAREYRGKQRLLALGSWGLNGMLMVVLVARPPRWVRRALERAGARPVTGAALAGASYVPLAAGVALPLSAIAEQRARDVGLSTQTWRPWLADAAKSTALGAAMTGLGAALATTLIRRFPRAWWLPGAGGMVGLSALFAFAAPVVIDPLFNKFDRLPDGRLRSEILDLARRADVDVGDVFVVDASRRTTATNAYVWGLGRTKRVVLYDNLIDGNPHDQVRSVVAHELSHVVHRDVHRGLLWLATAAPAAALLVKELAERLSSGRALGAPAGLPALALATSLASAGLGVSGHVLSRRIEARADAFALNLTQEPDAFIALERSLAVSNVADPQTPRILQILLGSHPTTMERIGIGLAWARARAD